MRGLKHFVLALLFVGANLAPALAAHPGSGSDCLSCHALGASGDGPKVVPEEPGFMAKMFQNAKSLKGHPSVSCTGTVQPDGKLSGCHDPDKGFKKLLVTDTTNKPVDPLCVTCHQSAGKFGMHHPSYKIDKNGDGVGDYMVRPVAVQEVFGPFAPANNPMPLSKYPDSIVFTTNPEGVKKLVVAIPLGTTVEKVDDKEVTYNDVVICTTCHNPHYGYIVESGKEEEQKPGLMARLKGDALLRMKDYDNTLCLVCH